MLCDDYLKMQIMGKSSSLLREELKGLMVKMNIPAQVEIENKNENSG